VGFSLNFWVKNAYFRHCSAFFSCTFSAYFFPSPPTASSPPPWELSAYRPKRPHFSVTARDKKIQSNFAFTKPYDFRHSHILMFLLNFSPHIYPPTRVGIPSKSPSFFFFVCELTTALPLTPASRSPPSTMPPSRAPFHLFCPGTRPVPTQGQPNPGEGCSPHPLRGSQPAAVYMQQTSPTGNCHPQVVVWGR